MIKQFNFIFKYHEKSQFIGFWLIFLLIFLIHTANAMAINARLLQALEKASGLTLRIGKLNSEPITARTKANPDKMISPIIKLDITYLLIVIGFA